MRAHRSPSRMKNIAVVLAVVASIAAALLVTSPTARATTYVKGIISVDTTWGKNDTTYVATNDVTVRARATLTIMPGTTVKFDPGVHLYIEGSLLANGTQGKPITFAANNTGSLIPWSGIQFNASSSGSVSLATFDRPDRAITAISSSPSITGNTVFQAGVPFAFVGSSSFLSGNVIYRATNIGVYANASSMQIVDNRINGTAIGIQVERPGTLTISRNTITNVSSGFAVGILLTGGATASLDSNVIQGVRGANGPNGIAPGAPGRDGSLGIGVYVSGAPSVSITGNTIESVSGGHGGDGQPLAAGAGGKGGNGGAAAGIVVAATPDVYLQNNTVTSLAGGAGGVGGGGSTTANGGRGGDAGAAVAVEVASTARGGRVYTNTINGLSGGAGGAGGAGASTSGNGGVGGDADGIFLISVANPDVSGNSAQVLQGGLGGNGGVSTGGFGNGATGGAAMGVTLFSVVGSATVHSNTIATLTAGDGGRGQRGGYGGNASGVLPLGNNDGSFNATQVSFNQIQTVSGGAGGIGGKFGGNGGSASGVAVLYVGPSLSGNSISTLQGGRGGDAVDGTDGGRGGDADGIVGGIVANGRSASDKISGVTKGGAGSGPPVQTSYANGYYLVGNKSFTTRFIADNASFTSVGSYEFYVDNYTEAFAINSPFTKLAVMAAGNLTVENFLEVDALWPNGATPVAGAHVLVEDNGSPVWNRTTPTGIQSWIRVTDRVYINSVNPKDNRTQVTVTYATYNFANDPRSVNMGSSHTESFVMVDQNAPTSSANPLPTYENTFTFAVAYTASDGNGTGLGNITLWYRTGGGGGWTAWATQAAGNTGQFTFTASADGVYEFTTTADDLAGNRQSGPSANNTWTTVDTVRPGSHVNALGLYQTSSSFVVSWAPDPGVTDIATYSIQYLTGAAGWANWLVDTAATSGTFNSGTQGVIAFRSIAKDLAGNVELPPAGNDTWTIVDTVRPSSHTLPLPTYEPFLTFTVSWGPQFDTTDIASYRIQARDNGGAWTDTFLSTAPASANYTGQDGHVYEFRSIATDRAGNVEIAPAGNDSWTIVDVTPPDSAVAVLPAYENAVPFAISWGPSPGTVDIVAYRIQYKDGALGWADVVGYSYTTATAATFVGQDGHTYAFRSLAWDRAGNVEIAPATNDTWTIVDLTRPFVVNTAPLGENTNTTPWIVITFSEPMNRLSVEQAFSITPGIDGTFRWSADSRVVTFVPSRELDAGKSYFVAVDSSARDLAGNPLLQPKAFQFSTAARPFLADYWWLLLLVGAGVAGALFVIARRRSAEVSKPSREAAASKGREAIIEDVFLLYHRDGLLIKHETRRLRPDVDTDILSGMLTAVQAFVKDALRGDDYAELNEMTVGQMHILIGRGKWLVLAARIEGDGTESWTGRIERCIQDMEDHHWDQLEDWDGDMGLARVLAPYVKKLIQGGYA